MHSLNPNSENVIFYSGLEGDQDLSVVGCEKYFSKVDVIPSTHIEFLTVCASYRSNGLTYIKLHSVMNGALSSAREKASFSFNISMVAPAKDSTQVNQKDNEKLFNLRAARLDIAVDLQKDVIFYYQDNQTNGKIYYKSEFMFRGVSIEDQLIALPLPIAEIKVLRGQFLLFVLIANSETKDKVNYLYEYKMRAARERNMNNTDPHALDSLFKCMMIARKKLEECSRKVESGDYLNYFYINKENEIFFEFKTLNQNQTSADSLGRNLYFIDVYRYESAANDFEKIIYKWAELKSLHAYRFASPEIFVQVVINYIDNNSNVSVFVSPRRYKTTPRLAFSSILLNTEIKQVYFDENARKLYFVAINRYFYCYILNVRMQIKYSLGFIDSKQVLYPFSEADAAPYGLQEYMANNTDKNSFLPAEKIDSEPLPHWVAPPCKIYTTFAIGIQQKKVKQIFCLNFTLKPGNYFFQASSLGFGSNNNTTSTGSDPSVKVVRESLPEGLSKELDYSDVFKGSFLKLIANQSCPLAKVVDIYLDPYVYTLKVHKIKFLESVTAIDTSEGDMTRLYLSIATKYENILYSGPRFQNAISSSNFVTSTMRDFRTLTKFYPINATDVLMQVEEMTYTVNVPTRKNADTPSQGINGVCANSTVIIHDLLGKILVCFHESNVFIKKLQRNEEIEQLVVEVNSPEAEWLLRPKLIQFIKASEFFQNYIFVFFKLLQPKSGVIAGPAVDVLRMAVFSIKNTVNTRLVLINESPFSPDDPMFLGLEFAGEKFVVLYKTQATSSKGAGEIKLRVYTVLAAMMPKFMYDLTLPDRLALPSTINLYVTDIYSEQDLDTNQNTIIDSTSHNYQISFKMILTTTKEVKVLVFNPHLQPIDSLSIIEPPASYQIIDMGHFFQLTPRSQVRSIMILAAKTDKLDEEFYSKDREVYVFLVNDMTPSLVMLPYNSSGLVFKDATTRLSNIINFKFNVTSSIYSPAYINSSKLTQVFDDVDKNYTIEYSPWTSSFASRIEPDSKGNRTKSIEINSMLYESSMEKKNLKDFFIRLDPTTFVIGSVFSHSGSPQSTVEEYMGVVEVMKQSVSRVVETNNIDNTTRPENQKGPVDFFLSWTCNMTSDFISKWYNNLTVAVDQQCNRNQAPAVYVSWNNNITAILPNNSITSAPKSDNLVNRGFLIINKVYFFLEGSTVNGTNVIQFCRANISFMKDAKLEVQSREKWCAPVAEFTNLKDLHFNVLQTSMQDRYFVRIVEFNTNLQVFSQACYYVFKDSVIVPNDTNKTNDTNKPNKAFYRVSDNMYYSTNNLRFQYFEDTSNKDISIVNAVYFRWQDNTKLLLVIHSTILHLENQNIIARHRHYELQLSEIHSDYNSLRQMVKMIDIVVPRQTSLSRDPNLRIMVVFRMANAYLMQIERSQFEDKDVILSLSYFMVAPIENPFIGFTAESDTPMPLIQGSYIFRVLNFQASSYLLVYTIDKNKLIGRPESEMKNIFCINEADKSNTNTGYTSNVDRYIQTSAVLVLEHRPVLFSIIQNFDIRLPHEHRLFYITSEEKIVSVNFSSYINIRIRSHQMASSFIRLNFTGSFNRSQQIILKVINVAGIGQDWWSITNFISILSIILILAFSGLLAVGILYLMEKDMHKQLITRKDKYVRHSLKPVSSALLQVFQKSVQPIQKKEIQEKKVEEPQSNSSDDSDDYTNWAYRKNEKYRAMKYGEQPREAEEEHEPKHRENDGIPRGQK